MPRGDYDPEKRGALFREDEDRRKSDKAPLYRGHLTINGVKYRLAAWVRETRDGKKFMSLAAESPEDAPQRRKDTAPHTAADDEIPF